MAISKPEADSALSNTNKEPSEAKSKTVEQLNQIMNANNDVNFKIDKGSGRMVIQVVDRETNTVIRQIPSKRLLRFRKH